MSEIQKIVGVFDTYQGAIDAIEGLKRQGYLSDEISVIAKDKDEAEEVTETTETKTAEGLAAGLTTGGVLGGVTGLLAGIGALAIPGIGPILAAGPIAATITGAAVGAWTGGLVGGLIGMGIPQDEAERYDEYVRNGRILVMVDADSRRDRYAYDTFRQYNSANSDLYDSERSLRS
ncbi:general stress protein [Paenibacillus spongiae]|uniref:General stress protein n=1 Tax=Paenibacillus spongiae TaxID=2909671 RepID=A0ABY5SB45_9BACL|nr:general stress protein [Paenibacillus spongiae]UVI30884.1 general stress protein [Paenibacillus spongiae]